jgi:hypothetical protein
MFIKKYHMLFIHTLQISSGITINGLSNRAIFASGDVTIELYYIHYWKSKVGL